MSTKQIESDRKRSRPVTKRSAFKKNKLLLPFLLLAVVLIIVASVIIVFNPFSNEIIEDDNQNNTPATGNPVAVFDTSMGTIKVELYKDKAPNTVNNFISYANDGFFDGLVFHRVIDNFMIQGGGFYPDGTEKETKDPIDLEIHDDLKHVDGAIAMARTSDPNSATSQFFINDGAQPDLEPGGVDQYGYAVFGGVTEGMEVVRSIASVDTEVKYVYHQSWPKDDVIINSITIEN